MTYYLGVDIGSLSCDAVIVDSDEKVVSRSVVPTGARNRDAIASATDKVLAIAGLRRDEVGATVSTGYGRDRVDDRLAAVTEITCHARGIRSLLPSIGVLIDIGGQDSKAIRISEEGRVEKFVMNDKCAAGTGRFLEAMARALEVDIDELATLDVGAETDLTLSSMCTVFAESEVVSLIGCGTRVNEIVAGLNRAIARRTASLVKRVSPQLDGVSIAMSGGVARNAGVIRAIGQILETEVAVPDEPDTVGALGAALIARERALGE